MSANTFGWSDRHRQPLLASPPTSFQLRSQAQSDCPLFSLLPVELRITIFEDTLTDYESTDYFYRPDDRNQDSNMLRDCRPRRSTDTQLLRTCQRVYTETWLIPFIFAEHIFYVGPRKVGTNEDSQRDRSNIITQTRMSAYLQVLKDYRDNHNSAFRIPPIERVRYYVHFKSPNPGFLLSLWAKREAREFDPRCVTFSLSYKNSWMRQAYGYNLSAKWVNESRFPISVNSINMELGKFSNHPELREIVSEVISKWFFRRQDGAVFRAAEDGFVYRRWVAQEPSYDRSTLAEKVYIIPIVTWKPVVDFDPFADGYECPDLDLTSIAKRLDRSPLEDITRAINRVTAH